jgi:hypothetical protein
MEIVCKFEWNEWDIFYNNECAPIQLETVRRVACESALFVSVSKTTS